MKKMTGREAVQGSGIGPVKVWGYQPKMMSGMDKFEQAVRNGEDRRRAAQVPGDPAADPPPAPLR
jgi:hypothetical protein